MNAMVTAWRDVFRRGRWWPPTLAFDEVQEQRFISATREARFTHFIRSGWVGLLCYNLFCFSDSLMAPDVIDEALKIRLLGFTPLAMAVLLISTVARDWVLSWRDGVIEVVVISSAMLAALSLVWILTSSHTEVAPLYRSGLVPILVFGNLVLRFRFKGAVWFTVLILVIYGLSVALHWGRSTPYAAFEIPQFLFVSAIGLYTLVINFRIEMEERRRFQRSESSAAARAPGGLTARAGCPGASRSADRRSQSPSSGRLPAAAVAGPRQPGTALERAADRCGPFQGVQ